MSSVRALEGADGRGEEERHQNPRLTRDPLLDPLVREPSGGRRRREPRAVSEDIAIAV
jgi:hypothetical protein